MIDQRLVAVGSSCVRRFRRNRGLARRPGVTGAVELPPASGAFADAERTQRSVRVAPFDRQSSDGQNGRLHRANGTRRPRKRLHEYDDDGHPAAAAARSTRSRSFASARSTRTSTSSSDRRATPRPRSADADRDRFERRRAWGQSTNSATARMPTGASTAVVTIPTGARRSPPETRSSPATSTGRTR